MSESPGRRPAAFLLTAVVLAVLALNGATARAEPALPGGFQDTVVFEGLEQPTTFSFAADGRVFVAEKSGKIKVFENLEDPGPPEVFADLRTQVYDHGDRGLLGLALDPDFPAEPYVYALYTYDHVLGDPEPAPRWGSPETTGDFCPPEDLNGADDCVVSGRLVRLTAEPEMSKAVEVEEGVPLQLELIDDWCQQFSSHSVGALQFGPEGALYAGGGDGASFTGADYGQLGDPPNPCGDPPGGFGVALTPPAAEGGSLRSQNLANLGGSIIRIDSSTGDAWPGNPLIGIPGADPRIVAYGFRNPFRFTTHPQTGEIYVGNVGSSQIEEIDRFAAPPVKAFNSGWPCYEGSERQFLFKTLGLGVCDNLYAAEPAGASAPFFHYSHGEGVVPGDECSFSTGSALSGLAFYQGPDFPAEYDGALFFADSVRGCIYAMPSGDDGRPDPESTEVFMRGASVYPGVEIKLGPDGDLYYASLFSDEEYGDGAIHKVTYAPDAPTARLTATPQWGAEIPLHVDLDANASTDPQGGQLTYEWELNEDEKFDETGGATQSLDLTEAKNHEVAVRVKDPQGLTSVARVTIYPGAEPPTVNITKPKSTNTWGVGDAIGFEGDADDFEGGYLGGIAYRWTMRLAHCPTGPENCHKHPLQTVSGVTFGGFTAPDHDYPSYIEVTARVTDHRGLSATDTITIHPRTVELEIGSVPPGIPLTAGLKAEAAPFSLTSIEGSEVVLAAPQTAQLGGKKYVWEGWSNGEARVHSIVADENASLDAVYSEVVEPQPPSQPSDPPAALALPVVPVLPVGEVTTRDNSAPRTKLLRRPPRKTRMRVAIFSLGSNEPRSQFRCKLDRGRYRPCGSRQVYRRLRPGRHVFRAYAVDAAGNRDRTPIAFGWRVLGRAR